MWVPEELEGCKLPREAEGHVALPLMHGKWWAIFFFLVMKYVVVNDTWGIFVKIFAKY